MSVVLKIPIKQKYKGIDEGSGKIWDICECPFTLNMHQIKEIESAWSSIPKKYTDDITNVVMDRTYGVGGGQYVSGTNPHIYLYIELGDSVCTIHHEVHHHIWSTKRLSIQKTKFRKGVRKLMNEYNKSPTAYSDSFIKKNIKYSSLFYDEVHSEVGTFINAEESMRARANFYNPNNPEWDQRINDDVIDKYVDLYHKVFG